MSIVTPRMTSFTLPALQKFQAEVRDTSGPGQDGQGTGRSRSTSVGSSQKSLPGAWASPPEADAASSSFAKETVSAMLEKGLDREQKTDMFGDLGHLEQPLGMNRAQLPLLPRFPGKTTTFDDFLSPAGSQRSERSGASPMAPPGLTLDPPDPLDALPNALGMMERDLDLWRLEEPMEHIPPPAYTPQATMPWQPAPVNPVPSVGSASHGTGQCKPCAFHHTKGCQYGAMCTFCHVCLPGEKKRRQKEKQQAAKARECQLRLMLQSFFPAAPGCVEVRPECKKIYII